VKSYRTLTKVTLALLLGISLFACQGDDELVEQEENRDPTKDEAAIAKGKELYTSLAHGCNSCHGDDGKSEEFKRLHPASRYEYDKLVNKIATSMPPRHTGDACSVECAEFIAKYMHDEFW